MPFRHNARERWNCGICDIFPVLKLVVGKRLLYRPLTGTTEVLSVGIARASKGDVTPAGEKFCEILRRISDGATAAKSKRANPRTQFVPLSGNILPMNRIFNFCPLRRIYKKMMKCC